MILGPACMLEGALLYGIGAAAHDNGWKGFGLFTHLGSDVGAAKRSVSKFGL